MSLIEIANSEDGPSVPQSILDAGYELEHLPLEEAKFLLNELHKIVSHRVWLECLKHIGPR